MRYFFALKLNMCKVMNIFFAYELNMCIFLNRTEKISVVLTRALRRFGAAGESIQVVILVVGKRLNPGPRLHPKYKGKQYANIHSAY